MTRTTANRHLRRLLEEGKLKNIGKRMQPIYVAAAGYYGVSCDVLRSSMLLNNPPLSRDIINLADSPKSLIIQSEK